MGIELETITPGDGKYLSVFMHFSTLYCSLRISDGILK